VRFWWGDYSKNTILTYYVIFNEILKLTEDLTEDKSCYKSLKWSNVLYIKMGYTIQLSLPYTTNYQPISLK